MKIRLNNSADATAVVSIANKFKDCDIDGKFGRYIIDLKSILGVLSFELPKTEPAKQEFIAQEPAAPVVENKFVQPNIEVPNSEPITDVKNNNVQ